MPTEPAIQRDNARNRFLAACSLAGAATTAYRGPPVEGSDAPCWVDIARLGSPDAEAALVLCCVCTARKAYAVQPLFQAGWSKDCSATYRVIPG